MNKKRKKIRKLIFTLDDLLRKRKEAKEYVEKIIVEGTAKDKVALFSFSVEDDTELIAKKFWWFTVSFYSRYIKYKTKNFHKIFIKNYIETYKGNQNYLNIGFRGSSKTSLTKLFTAFILLNDTGKFRKHLKVYTNDLDNAKQFVTDVYNMVLEVSGVYGMPFMEDKKDERKGDKTKSSFDFEDGRKLSSGTVGQSIRGKVADAYRPDFLLFDDLEDSEVVASIVKTIKIIRKSDEAIQGMAIGGSYMVTANYISNEGVIEWFKQKQIKTTITPIIDRKGNRLWAEAFSEQDIKDLKKDAFDWDGDYMCQPSSKKNKIFDEKKVREALKHITKPIKNVKGFEVWGEYIPGEKYAIGGDTSEGIGRDANTMALINFTKNAIIGIYNNNEIAPDDFGKEMGRVGWLYGEAKIAVELNNTGHATITSLKAINYGNLYKTVKHDYIREIRTEKIGFITDQKNKIKMIYDFKRAFERGELKIPQEEILLEMLHYTKADLHNQSNKSSSIVTRHFDLLIATCIAYQMREEIYKTSGGIKVTKL